MSSARRSQEDGEVSRWVAPYVGDNESGRNLTSKSSIAKARQDAHNIGYAEGLAAGKQEALALTKSRLETLDQLIAHLAGPLKKLEPETLDAMVELSVSVSEALINRELSLDPALILQAVSSALAAIPDSTRQLKIRVHPEDQTLVKNAYTDSSLALNAVIVADSAVARGGVIVESGATLVDAQLGSRLDELLADLLHSAKSADSVDLDDD